MVVGGVTRAQKRIIGLVGFGVSDVPDSPACFDDRIWWSPARRERERIKESGCCISCIMGRIKLKLKRLENTNGRQATYAKRKHGIMKKASSFSCFHPLESLLYAAELSNQAGLYYTQLSEIHKRLSYWTNPVKINNIEQLDHMENSLKKSLNEIRRHKEIVQKQHLMSLECTRQFQNGIHMPFGIVAEQNLQPLSWISNNDRQHLVLPEDPNLLPQQDVECSGSSSFGSYSGYFSTDRTSEMSNSGQENCIVNELSITVPMRQQLGGQIPYLPFNLNVPTDAKCQPPVELNPAENSLDYPVNGNFEFLRPVYDSNQHSWASTSGPCGVPMFDEQLYSQIVDVKQSQVSAG
uniref:MADS14 n=1 Tax=Hippophae rhamnoides TaxID=193516 RepID=A0AAU7LKN1_9ROSA